MGRLRLRFSAQAAMVGPVYPSLLVFTSSGWTALPTHASMSTGTAALLSSLSNCCTAVLPFHLSQAAYLAVLATGFPGL